VYIRLLPSLSPLKSISLVRVIDHGKVNAAYQSVALNAREVTAIKTVSALAVCAKGRVSGRNRSSVTSTSACERRCVIPFPFPINNQSNTCAFRQRQPGNYFYLPAHKERRATHVSRMRVRDVRRTNEGANKPAGKIDAAPSLSLSLSLSRRRNITQRRLCICPASSDRKNDRKRNKAENGRKKAREREREREKKRRKRQRVDERRAFPRSRPRCFSRRM